MSVVEGREQSKIHVLGVTAVVSVKSDGGLAQGGSCEGRKKCSDPKYILNMLKVEPKS